MILNLAILRQLLRRGFEAGWEKSAQGNNSEHNNLTAQELLMMRESAVETEVQKFKEAFPDASL